VTRILLVEDDDNLRRALTLTLRSRGHHVEEVADGRSALSAVGRHPLDVVVLDLGLPDVDGVDVIRRIRESDDLPIIVLSARRDEIDKVRALRAAERRAGRGTETRVVRTPDFTVDLGMKAVHDTGGTVIHLTPTEWGVLETLIRANGLLVTSSELLSEVWGPGYEKQANYLRVYVGQLRRKLERDPGHPRYLITAPGLGYRFAVGSEP
jgi:two-component system KDP operon response regulator KdpE